jgi:hypothetical protein
MTCDEGVWGVSRRGQGDAGTRGTIRWEVRSMPIKERRDRGKNKRENNGIK